MRTETNILIGSMRILSRDIQSGDGVANAAIHEAADMLQEQQAEIERLRDSIRSANRLINLLSMLIPEFETDEELKELFEEWKSLGAELEVFGKEGE